MVDCWIEFIKGERTWEDLNMDALSTEERNKAKARAIQECESMEEMEEEFEFYGDGKIFTAEGFLLWCDTVLQIARIRVMGFWQVDFRRETEEETAHVQESLLRLIETHPSLERVVFESCEMGDVLEQRLREDGRVEIEYGYW